MQGKNPMPAGGRPVPGGLCRQYRKPLQIAVGGEEAYENLYVLCDDGSIWTMTINAANPVWHRVDSIPQDPPKENGRNAELAR